MVILEKVWRADLWPCVREKDYWLCTCCPPHIFFQGCINLHPLPPTGVGTNIKGWTGQFLISVCVWGYDTCPLSLYKWKQQEPQQNWVPSLSWEYHHHSIRCSCCFCTCSIYIYVYVYIYIHSPGIHVFPKHYLTLPRTCLHLEKFAFC